MKKHLILIVLTSLFLEQFIFAQQQNWIWQNPLPQGNSLNDIDLLDANVLFATGQGGTIMKSSDSGNNWNIFNTGTTKILRRFEYFQNGFVAYASGSNATIIKTTDGGEAWQDYSLSQNIDFYAFDFVDELNGFAAGNPGHIIFKTSDGGNNWTQSDSLPSAVISAIKFPFDNLNGFASGWMGDSVIYKTTDGGTTWIEKPIPIQSAFNSIKTFNFVNNQTGYSAGNGIILKTTDFGETWTSQYSGNGTFNSICFPENELTGYVVGDFNTVFKTTDGGTNWLSVNTNLPRTYFFNSVAFVNNNLGFVVGSDGIILKTTDGGSNWINLQSSISFNWFQSIDFPENTQTGFISCLGGKVLKTINGGNNWDVQNTNSTVGLRKINFLDNDTGYVVGDNGAIFKTVDGGQNWNYLLSGINQYLFDVEFPVNSLTGYVSGETGKIAKTTDGGSTWVSLGSFTKDILAMSFPTDNLVGYIATGFQKIYKTNDGGLNWEIKYDGNIPGVQMNDILFPFDDQTGYALSYGNGSKIFKTTDGGNSWQIIDAGITQELYNISFPTPQVGYISAFHDNFSSILLKTTDSGSSWNKIQVPYGYALKSVCFPNEADTGYVVGELSGAILKTVNGGGLITSVFDLPIEQPVSDYVLFQNYPNPFNPSTTIKYSIPSLGTRLALSVQLKVYDVLGNEIATLVDEYKPAGTYEVVFNLASIIKYPASGIYFYQLKAGNFLETKKMIYLK